MHPTSMSSSMQNRLVPLLLLQLVDFNFVVVADLLSLISVSSIICCSSCISSFSCSDDDDDTRAVNCIRNRWIGTKQFA